MQVWPPASNWDTLTEKDTSLTLNRPDAQMLCAGEQRAGARRLQLEHNAQRRGPPVLRDAVHIHQCGRRASAAGAGHRLRGRVDMHR